MGLFTNLFKKPVREHQLYDFRTVTVADLDNIPNGIRDMYDRRMDGLLIKNVLTLEEVETIKTNLNKLEESKKTVLNEGFSNYPMSFAQQDQTSENSRERLKAYFEGCVEFRETFLEVFGVDFEEKVQMVLGKLAGGRTVEAPIGVDDVGTFTPGNFRFLKPGPGTIKAHCGNYFHKEFPHFFSHLSERSHVKDQLSYFLMLQPAEAGGELRLFDIEWKDVETRLHGDTVLEGKDGKKYDLDHPRQVKYQDIKPEAGDMITFAGGQIWHRVEYVQGSRRRLTLGGFLSISHDDQKIYYWA